MYFHSVIDSASCHTNLVSLSQLPTDLASAATTPNYTYNHYSMLGTVEDLFGLSRPGPTCSRPRQSSTRG
ncbi:MAG: hypothetical protein M3065_17595 [Actinomycetota bacterium]|nr:hypothetical protein [Actinomycetota bacterium]